MSLPTPAIYSAPPAETQLTLYGRTCALIVCGCCLAVLIVAARLTPDPAGLGTHTEMGFHQCGFLEATGLPCPSCGMTTSFAWFVRGNLIASFYVQPMGTVLAAMCALTFWITLYMAISGKTLVRLVRGIPSRYYLTPFLAFWVVAWGWKIFIHLRGIDGWR
jgi:hypothetical protein